MGHQTSYKKCQKCGRIILKTIAFGKEIITTNCKCKSNK